MNQIPKTSGLTIGISLILLGLLLFDVSNQGQENQSDSFDLVRYAAKINDPTINQALARAEATQTPQASTELAKLFLDRARLTADLDAYLAAQAANDQALAEAPKFGPALIVNAAILNGLHDFPHAKAAAEWALHAVPNDPTSLGVLGSALLEMGRQQTGADAIQKMVDVRPGLSSYALAAHIRFLEGDTDGAIELLSMAFQAVGRRPQDAAWVLVQLSDLYLTQGKTTEATNVLTEARRLVSSYPFPTADLAGIKAQAEETSAAAERLYKEAIVIIPQIEFHAGLGDLYIKLGRDDDAEQQYQLAEAIGDNNEKLKVLDNRGYALFLADHNRRLDTALAIAKREYRIRRDPYGADALAWTLHVNGQSRQAQRYSQKALSLGTQDPVLFYHAGVIAHALNKKSQAKEYLTKAVELNPNFDLLQAEQARKVLSGLDR